MFERERIRLRKGVQEATAPTQTAPNSANKSKQQGRVPARIAVKGAHIHAESSVRDSNEGMYMHVCVYVCIYMCNITVVHRAYMSVCLHWTHLPLPVT